MKKKSTLILEKKIEDRSIEEIKYLLEKTKTFSKKNQELVKEQKKEMEKVLAEKENVIEEYEADFSKTKENIGKKIFRSFSSKVKDLGNGVMEAIISSEVLDRHGERIDIQGMSIKEYMKNPIVADGHDYDKPSVGRTLKLTKTADRKLIAKFEWAKDISERAKLLYNLYKDGFQFAFSIGFIPEEADGNVYTKATMIEFSPVLIGANPEALLLAKSKGFDVKDHLDVKDALELASKMGLDIDDKGNYNDNHQGMLILKEVLKKALEDIKSLTLKEVDFLKENKEEISAEDQETLKSILVEEKKEEPKEDVAKVVADALAPIQDEVKKLKDLSDPVHIKKFAITSGKYSLDENGDVTKEEKFKLYVKGLAKGGNFREYIDVVGKDAMNTTEDSEVVPPAEFLSEVERLEALAGVTQPYTDNMPLNSKAVTMLMGDDDLEMDFTDEAGKIKSKRIAFTQKTLTLRKATGILPMTQELEDYSAVRLWNDAAQRFARAVAKKRDYLVFNETSAVSPKNKGVLHVSGTNGVTIDGDSIADLVHDDLIDALYGVPTQSALNGRWYFHRTIMGTIMKIKDDYGRSIWSPALADGTPSMVLGKPYTLVDLELPSVSEDAAETPFIVFGDLKYVTVGETSGLRIEMFNNGIVGDPDEEDQDANTLNLLTQDMRAMRGVKKINGIVRFPEAFSVISTGSAS